MTRPIPGLMIDQQPEPVVIRMCLWGEARGESPRGMLAILWVLRNRALKHDTSLKAQVLKPWQFSSFNANDPNRKKLLTAYVEDPHSWKACDTVAQLFESGLTSDPTGGATHYYVENMPNPPAWGRGHKDWHETVVIGAHVFGRAA